MKFLLRIKHWQLFCLYLPIPILIVIAGMIAAAAMESYTVMISAFVLATSIHGIAQLGWMFQVALFCNKKLPPEVHMNLNVFRFFFFFPLMYFAAFFGFISIKVYTEDFGNLFHFLMIIPLHLFAMFCIIFITYFVAKSIKTVELQRKVTFGDFVGEFFLIMFFVVGIWILQPKINNLAEQKNEV